MWEASDPSGTSWKRSCSRAPVLSAASNRCRSSPRVGRFSMASFTRTTRPDEVVLIASATTPIRVPRDEIEEMNGPAACRSCRAGLDKQLSPQELADLSDLPPQCEVKRAVLRQPDSRLRSVPRLAAGMPSDAAYVKVAFGPFTFRCAACFMLLRVHEVDDGRFFKRRRDDRLLPLHFISISSLVTRLVKESV